MQLLGKFKEVLISVFPVTLIVIILHFTIAPLEPGMLPKFIGGAILLVIGLSLFLLGTEIGVLPMGELMGNTLAKSKKFLFLVVIGFFIGFMITMAEPDLHVLGEQFGIINPYVSKSLLLIMVSSGAGIFVSIGLLRSAYNLSLKRILFIGYIIVFILAFFASPYILPVSFDSGGVTTGPMTVPFAMALYIGLAHMRSSTTKESEDESFGLVGLMSLGPIASMLVLGLLFKQDLSGAFYNLDSSTSLGVLLPRLAAEVAIAFLPMIIIFLLFQLVYLKLALRKLLRLSLGILYTYIGLIVFLLGANYGFSPAGSQLGGTLASLSYNWVIIPAGIMLGFTVVLAEPAVWVLTQQIERITAGLISRKVMLVTLSIGIAVAVGLAMLRIYTGLHSFWFLIPGYALALILMKYVDTIFIAIAFDSGGVASGVMASTFILPFALGACMSVQGNVLTDAFGAVAMIAMVPLIAIQLLGLVFKIKRMKAEAEYAALTQIEAEIEAEEEDLRQLLDPSENNGIQHEGEEQHE